MSLALFGAYTVRAKIASVDILDTWTFSGLLFGAMMPYAFSAMTMKSVGVAANDMVRARGNDSTKNGVVGNFVYVCVCVCVCG